MARLAFVCRRPGSLSPWGWLCPVAGKRANLAFPCALWEGPAPPPRPCLLLPRRGEAPWGTASSQGRSPASSPRLRPATGQLTGPCSERLGLRLGSAGGGSAALFTTSAGKAGSEGQALPFLHLLRTLPQGSLVQAPHRTAPHSGALRALQSCPRVTAWSAMWPPRDVDRGLEKNDPPHGRRSQKGHLCPVGGTWVPGGVPGGSRHCRLTLP